MVVELSHAAMPLSKRRHQQVEITLLLRISWSFYRIILRHSRMSLRRFRWCGSIGGLGIRIAIRSWPMILVMHVKIRVFVMINLFLMVMDTIADALKETRAMLTSLEDAKVYTNVTRLQVSVTPSVHFLVNIGISFMEFKNSLLNGG